MRVPVLSMLVLGVLDSADAACAQTPIPDPFVSANADVPGRYPPIEPRDPSRASEPVLAFDHGRRSVAIGDGWRLEASGESRYPVDTFKLRDEGAYLARPLSERLTLRAGAWRSKLQWEGQPSLRSSYVGFDLAWTY